MKKSPYFFLESSICWVVNQISGKFIRPLGVLVGFVIVLMYALSN